MAEPSSPAPAETSTQATSSPTPIFGSASTFGSASGFAGFKGVEASDKPAAAAPAEGEEEAPPEEECAAEFKPLVHLDEVEVQTGEEGEIVRADFKCKLYRFDPESAEWKERGVGQVKLLEHKENHKIRLLMRQEKTLKIRANHIVMPGTKLQEHSGSEKSVVWSAVDFADEQQKNEMFCMRFASVERAQEFMGKHDEAMEHNEKLLAADEAAEGGAAEEAAAPPAAAEADQLAEQASQLKVTGEEATAAEATA